MAEVYLDNMLLTKADLGLLGAGIVEVAIGVVEFIKSDGQLGPDHVLMLRRLGRAEAMHAAKSHLVSCLVLAHKIAELVEEQDLPGLVRDAAAHYGVALDPGPTEPVAPRRKVKPKPKKKAKQK